MAERDTRFGGNMERANVGEQYSRPRQTGTPNFGGPTRPQGGTYSHELGHTGGYDFNPRPNLKGHFQEPAFHKFPQSGPAGAPVEGPWNREYDTPMREMGGGLGGLSRRIGANLMSQMAGLYGGRRTPEETRQESINWGREAGLGNRISFAGERGRDILNPNEMRVNAPSVEGWKAMAQRKMWMDRMYQGEDNPYYGQDQDWGTMAATDTGIGSTDEYQMAKVYTNQDPGMVNRNKFWFDSLTPESEAINKVLDMPAMEEMRQGSEKDWNYKDFREKVPQYLWDQLPDEAFETLSDFRNQQRITT